MTVCMKSTPAERCRFLLIGIGDTASRRCFAYGKKLLLMLFSMSRRRFTLFNVVSTPHIDPRQCLSPTKLTPFRLA
jgi:hypothetical protein